MIVLSIPLFRSMFPAYSNVTTYPDALVTMNWEFATEYISADDYGVLSGNSRSRAIYLMTAHIFNLSDIIAGGQVPAMVSGSSIDKISVSLTPPPITNQLHWWLSLTGYGAQLLALIRMKMAGGFYIGGSAEHSNFRKVDGSF